MYIAGLLKKTIYMNKSCKKIWNPNRQFASSLKIQVDSFLTVTTVLEDRMKSLKKQRNCPTRLNGLLLF